MVEHIQKIVHLLIPIINIPKCDTLFKKYILRQQPVRASHSFRILFFVFVFVEHSSQLTCLLQTNKSTHPYIHFRAIILLALKEFWCGIGRTATPCLQQLSSREHVTEAEI